MIFKNFSASELNVFMFQYILYFSVQGIQARYSVKKIGEAW